PGDLARRVQRPRRRLRQPGDRRPGPRGEAVPGGGHPVLRKMATVSAALSSACLLSAAALSPAAATDRGQAAAPRPRKSASSMPRRAGVQLVKDLRRAWQITKGQGVTVAIIGGHVDPAAPGLAGKVITGRGFGNYRRAARYDSTVIASAVAGSGPSQQNP